VTKAHIWQYDGAPGAHNSSRVRDSLQAMFPGYWIGRRGVVGWSADSPDFT